ncbi:MAG: alpha/beta hydrolase [Novosphingobium sp.]|nr:alpha/beta hydrolase [Novosphingobium sp.]
MEAVLIDVATGHAQESQSGLQLLRPRIWGAFHRAPGKVAAIVIHPTSNFMHHYLLEPLSSRGIATLGLNTRYLGSDVTLLLERAIQDLGAGVHWLRAQGYERIMLIGNSGGAALVSLYQAQAERLDITATPAGDPIDLSPADLPPAQGIALNAAHLGRSRLMTMWIDPAQIDEADPLATDPALDMFNPDNGPPYSSAFLALYRAAQRRRLERLEEWTRARLRQLRAIPGGPTDMAFVVHRTLADPRCLDAALDPNDRPPGTTVWGPPKVQNYAANSMGRYTSLTAFLSQWAPSSRGDGPACLAQTSVPVLLAEHTADSSTFPSDHEEWARAAQGRLRRIQLKGGNHYLAGQPALVEQLADEMAAFAQQL